MKIYFIAFSASHLVERSFCEVALLLSKQRNRLKITERGNLRLLLSEFQPDLEKVVSLHQRCPTQGPRATFGPRNIFQRALSRPF